MTYNEAKLLGIKLREISNKIAGDRYQGGTDHFLPYLLEDDLNVVLKPCGLRVVDLKNYDGD